jgi:hypothetical protein
VSVDFSKASQVCVCVCMCACVCVCVCPSTRTFFLNFIFYRKGEQMVCVLKSDIPRSTRTSSCASKLHRYVAQDFSLHTRLDNVLFEQTNVYSCSGVPRSTRTSSSATPKNNCTETRHSPRGCSKGAREQVLMRPKKKSKCSRKKKQKHGTRLESARRALVNKVWEEHDGNTFSKVLYIVTLCRKYTRALRFCFCQGQSFKFRELRC